MPNIFSGLLLLCVSLAPSSYSQASPDGRFPIMAWDYVDNDRILESMHEAGITAVAFVRPRMLDSCQKFDLKCIVFDERLSGTQWSKPFDGELFRKNFLAVAKEVGRHSALYGYHIKDELPETDFPELAKAVAAVKELTPGQWPYINLFPGEGQPYKQLGWKIF